MSNDSVDRARCAVDGRLQAPIVKRQVCRAVLLLASVFVAQACADAVPLYDNLGDHHHAITAAVPEAQAYFDQGLRLVYAFNHTEAIRAFEYAAQLDPDCAMCFWGVALAYGPNINAPMDSANGAAAYAAAQEALSRASKVGDRDAAFVRALAQRYVPNPVADRPPLDSAYARAMRDLVTRYPDDQDAATFYAASLMNLRPWNYWTSDGEPHPGALEILEQLEGVIGRNPDHPGACHYFIHAVEAAYPERAVACAERLAGLMPGAGHVVHMPAHVYVRVGRYADAVETNVHAIHADETYIADQRPGGLYPGAYYPHAYHFLAFAASMAGRSEVAVEAARKVASKVPTEVAQQVPWVGTIPAHAHLVLTTFGMWEDVLSEPLPPAELSAASCLAHYARGVAFAAAGEWPQAEAELEIVERLAAASEAEFGAGGASPVFAIAAHALAAEIAARGGELEVALEQFEAAKRLQDGLPYDEPPPWYYPIRHSLGAVLLEAGRPAEAEVAYREDLELFPENGWSLFGLAESLRAQGKASEADAAEERFQRAWAGADVRLSASRF